MISGKLGELFVDLVVKDKLQPAIAAAQSQIALVQTQFSAMGTPKGQADVQAYVSSQEKLAASQKALQREFDVSRYGKFGMVMKDLKGAVSGFKEGLERLGGGGAGVLAPIIGGLGVMSAVAAASPDVFATLTGSVQYLAGSIGRLLLPVVIDICRWLQNAARWFLSLDDATRANIATAAKWTVGFLAVAGAIRLVSAALASMMAINPWILGLVGLAGLVTAVARLSSSSSASGLGAPPVRVGHSDDVATIHHRPVAAAPLGGASDLFPWLGEHLARAITALDSEGGTGPHSIAPTTVERRRGETSESFERRTAAHAEYARSGSLASASGVLAGRGAMAGAGGDPLLTARNFQSSFFSIEDQWRKLQQAGASLSPLDTEMMRFATEGRRYLEEIAGSTAVMAGRPVPRVGMT